MTIDPAMPPPAGGQRARESRRRNITGPARAVTVLLIGCCVTSVAVALYCLRRAALISDVRDGATPSDAALSAVDSTVQLASVADLCVTVATAITFVVWFWRLIANAQLIERMLPRDGVRRIGKPAPATGWSIGSWLIPLANFVLPAYYLDRTDRISDEAAGTSRVRPVIICWAVAFGLSNLLSRVVWRSDSTTLEGLETGDRRMVWIGLAYVITAALAILVVRRATDRQVRALDATGA